MRFLPIVDRELRVAARRRGAHGLRLLAALAALAIITWLCLRPEPGRPPTALGQSLFTSLSIMAFAYCLLIGPFITADCISSEKRDGTLGLLFLTDLRSIDVVLGKWVAASMAGFYGLLAVLPSLAVPLLFGGVTPAEYGRTALAVVNAVLFSLTGGILVSAMSRDHTKAILGSLIFVLAVSGLVPGLTVLIFKGFLGRNISSFPLAALSSPIYTGLLASDASARANARLFWTSLIIVHALCWLFMSASVVIVGRVWRKEAGRPLLWLLRLGRTKRWQRTLKHRLEINPIYALASRHRWPHWVFWTLVGIVAINIFWLTYGARHYPATYQFHQHFSTAMIFINRVWLAAMACKFFTEARYHGGLELILTTPMDVRAIRRGRRRALGRLFFWPVMAIAVLHWLYLYYSWAPNANQPNSKMFFRWQAILAGGSLIGFSTDVLAMSALGGWLSLSSKRLAFVILKTFALVTLLPWLLLYLFGGAQLLQKWFPTNYPVALPLVLVIKNLLFLAWASYKVRKHFRPAAAQTYRMKCATVESMSDPPAMGSAAGSVHPGSRAGQPSS